jgi:hypothetical protein
VLEHHLGEDARQPAARLALAAVQQAVRHLGVDPREPALRVTVNRADAALDALIGLLGATFASRRVRVMEDGAPLLFRFELGRRVLELEEALGPAEQVGPALALVRDIERRQRGAA